jgi:hypothetical protein
VSEDAPAAVDPSGTNATDAFLPDTSRTGTADIAFRVGDETAAGRYPATLCAAPYLLGEGLVYQAQAGDWRVTLAMEEQPEPGEVPLNVSDDQVRIVATVNGPGVEYARGPTNGGTFRLSDDLRRAEAMLELRPTQGGETARLSAVFVCN